MRGATALQQLVCFLACISIHAPHAGRDFDIGDHYTATEISIHAPHAGRDLLPEK